MPEEGLPDINNVNRLRRRFGERADEEAKKGNYPTAVQLGGLSAAAGAVIALFATHLRIAAIGE